MAIILGNGFTQDTHQNNPQDPRFLIFAPAVNSPLGLYSFAQIEMATLANAQNTDIIFNVQNLGAQAKATTKLEYRTNPGEPFQNITGGPELQNPEGVEFRITITANERAVGMDTFDLEFTEDPNFRWHTAQLAVIFLHEITFHAMDYIGMINTFMNWGAENIVDRPRLIDFHISMRDEITQHGYLVGGPAFNPNYLLSNYKRARAIFQARCYPNEGDINTPGNHHQDWIRFNSALSLDCNANIHHGPGISFEERWWHVNPTIQDATLPYYLPENVIVAANGLDWESDNEEMED